MKISLKNTIVVLIFLLLIIGVIAVYFSLSENEQVVRNECLGDNEVVKYDIEEKKRGLGDTQAIVEISVIDKKTNQQKYNFQIDNVFKNYHPMEVYKCGIYMIRLFNYDYKKTKQDPGFKSEIWSYQYNGEGNNLIILSEKDALGVFKAQYSYDFRIDPTETYIVLERGYLGKDDYALIIRNLKTKEDIFILSAKSIFEQYPNIIGNFDMLEWSKDSRYFWGNISEGAYVNGYFRIDTQNWTTDIFEAPDGAMGGSPLNINTGYLPIQPGQVWTGDYQMTQELKEQYRKEGRKSYLYLYNLFTKEKILIIDDEEPLWWFKPKWLSDTELKYELPTGEKRIYEI